MIRHIPIADLARLLHARDNPWKAMAMLQAYFDESGIDGGSRVVAAGGCLATEQTWTTVESNWVAELNRFKDNGFPIAAFHSVDCEHGNGDFIGIQREIRQSFPPRLAATLPQQKVLLLWSAVVKDDWDAATDDAFREVYTDPFYFCFEHCARTISQWSMAVAGSREVAVMYSENKQYKGRIEAIWTAYSRAGTTGNLKSFSTGSYKDYVPLQVADLVAYECLRYWDAMEFRVPMTLPNLRPAADILSSGGYGFGGMHTRQTIERAVKNFHEFGQIWSPSEAQPPT